MIYELREYVAANDKVNALHTRFKEFTLPLFQKHEIEVKGFWTDNKNSQKIIYLCQFDSIEAQKKAWAAFGSDPEWKKVKQESEMDGPITISMSSVLLDPVDYTPQP